MKDASEVYLATDEDREGEAIAWHLVDTLKPRVPVRRMVFHEITPEAIARAVANPRELDTALVDAQETRRILDRLYGYEVSPVLWKKVLPKLSAGRVQSVATRIVVERERERMAFHAADYWSLEGTFAVPRPGRRHRRGRADDGPGQAGQRRRQPGRHRPRLRPGHRPGQRRRRAPRRGRRPRAGRPARGPPGHRQPGRREALPAPSVRAVHHLDAADGRRPQARLVLGADHAGGAAAVRERPHHLHAYRLDEPVRTRRSTPPGSRPASCTATPTSRPRRAATRARPRARRRRTRRSARPVTASARPGSWPPQLARDEFRLYELIWQRTVASQMADAVGQTVSIRLAGRSATDEAVEFTASGRTITFPGFLKAYVESRDEAPRRNGDDDPGSDDAERRLPRLERGQQLDTQELEAKGHTTSPAGALHRAQPGRPARGARHRPPVDLRVDHADDPGPRVRLEEGQLAGALLHRVRRGQPAGAALRPARRLRLHRLAGGGARRDRRRHPAAGRLADRVLLRRRGPRQRRHRRVRRPEADRRPAARGDRRPRRQLHPAARHRPERRGRRRARRPLRPVPAGRRRGRAAGEHPRGPRARRADPREGHRAARGAVQRPRARHRPGVRPPGRGQGRPLRPVRHHGRARGQQGRPADGAACSRRCRRRRSPSRTR